MKHTLILILALFLFGCNSDKKKMESLIAQRDSVNIELSKLKTKQSKIFRNKEMVLETKLNLFRDSLHFLPYDVDMKTYQKISDSVMHYKTELSLLKDEYKLKTYNESFDLEVKLLNIKKKIEDLKTINSVK